MSSNNDLLFSIIVPTYNRAELIGTTITSLLNQTFKNYEIIVVDDGGDDNTKAVIEAIEDKRITYYWKENAERGAARNYGAALAKGKYVNFFDSDDFAYPNHLEVANLHIQNNTNFVVFHTSFDWKNAAHEKIRSSEISSGILNKHVIKNNILSPNNVFIRKDIFDQFKFSEDRDLSGTEDWFLWLRLCCSYSINGIKTITSSMIQHDTRSMTTATGGSTLKRTLALERNMKADPCIAKNPTIYKNGMAEMLFMTSLYYAIDHDIKQSLLYILKAMKYNRTVIFKKRLLAIVKHLVLNKFF